jgi:hypothetical protein
VGGMVVGGGVVGDRVVGGRVVGGRVVGAIGTAVVGDIVEATGEHEQIILIPSIIAPDVTTLLLVNLIVMLL